MFRQSNPAVVGVTVQGGFLRADINLIKKDGSRAGKIKSIQHEGKNISEAEHGKEVAVALPDVIVGRQIKEDDVLYCDVPEHDFIKLKKYLKEHEIEVLKELAEIKRREDALWGT